MGDVSDDQWKWIRENQQREWQDNMLRAQRESNQLQRQRASQPQQTAPTASQVGFAAGQTISHVAAGASAYAGTKAGQNHYERTGDLSEAAWRGAIAGRRWFVWGLSCVAWCAMVVVTFCMFMGMGVDYTDLQDDPTSVAAIAAYRESSHTFYAWMLSLPIVLIYILVIYKRNIDFSLFRRKPIYDLAKLVSPLFAWAPNWLLYAGFVITPVALQFAFLGLTPGSS